MTVRGLESRHQERDLRKDAYIVCGDANGHHHQAIFFFFAVVILFAYFSLPLRFQVVCRSSNPELEKLVGKWNVYSGVDVVDDEAVRKVAKRVKSDGGALDVVINNAGYFYEPQELVKTDSLNFDEQLKQINICALGPLRMNNALINSKALAEGAKLVIITSQAGSVEWRSTQNKDTGGDYGHHMSRSACNMAGKLLSEEVRDMGYTVLLLHPGFNRTEMTKKYEAIWDIEGAVEPSVGAKRVLYETIKNGIDSTGMFINCEDGLQIPW